MTTPGSFTTPTADMIAVHAALIGALDDAPSLIGSAEGTIDRVEIIGSFYDNVLEFLHVHHAGEDELIYPILEERCPEEKATLQRVDAQHTLLDEPMERARSALAAWREAPSVESGRTVVSLIGTVGETLWPHLGEEEATVLPIASAWMSPEEWGQLPGHALRSFRTDKPWLSIGLIREHLSPEHRDLMLARMPLELQTLWTEQWEPAFTSFISEVRL